MHAIVCQGNGRYYISAVFGYFRDITATDEHEKYIQSIRNPYWYCSTILQKDGFIYFVDDNNMTVEKIGEGYCYFKARHMKYRIIPE